MMFRRTIRRRWLATGLAGIILATGTAVPANAAPNPKNLRNREILQTAYYEPRDAYFQLAKDVVNRTGTGKWAFAVQKARNTQYKDRKGRLARIDTAELHQWIVETFDFADLPASNGVWVGLRYWCGVRMLTWADGETHRPGAFAPWDTPWHRTDIRCGSNNMPYMGVYYEPQSSRWKATGYNKRFRYYLIEFPPKEKEDLSKTGKSS